METFTGWLSGVELDTARWRIRGCGAILYVIPVEAEKCDGSFMSFEIFGL